MRRVDRKLYCSQTVTTFMYMYMYMYFMKNEAINVTNFDKAGCLLFPNEMKPTKYPAKKKTRPRKQKNKYINK